MRLLHRLLLCCVVLLGCVLAASAKETYVFDLKFGSRGTGNGQFTSNVGLSIVSGLVAVADCDNHRIELFDSDGNYQAQFGGMALPYQPVIVSGGGYYVLSYGSSNVTAHNASGLVMGSLASAGSGPQQIQSPRGIALNPTTHMLYIADTENNRISQWTTGGVFVRTFGTEGTGDGQLKLPYGVALDAAGNVYVADTDNHRIQKFSGTGDYLAKWPVGTGGEIGVPRCLTVSGNHVFVGSTTGMKVIKYTTDGAFVCQFGSPGTGDGQFLDLNGIAVDDYGKVFVSDGNVANSRVQRFVPNNTPTAPTTVAITPKPARDGDNLVPKPVGATD
ncbi:MAG: SMP-30/gluconolactonase/LRE family protein, partial [Bacteroidota bacterium]